MCGRCPRGHVGRASDHCGSPGFPPASRVQARGQHTPLSVLPGGRPAGAGFTHSEPGRPHCVRPAEGPGGLSKPHRTPSPVTVSVFLDHEHPGQSGDAGQVVSSRVHSGPGSWCAMHGEPLAWQNSGSQRVSAAVGTEATGTPLSSRPRLLPPAGGQVASEAGPPSSWAAGEGPCLPRASLWAVRSGEQLGQGVRGGSELSLQRVGGCVCKPHLSPRAPCPASRRRLEGEWSALELLRVRAQASRVRHQQ